MVRYPTRGMGNPAVESRHTWFLISCQGWFGVVFLSLCHVGTLYGSYLCFFPWGVRVIGYRGLQPAGRGWSNDVSTSYVRSTTCLPLIICMNLTPPERWNLIPVAATSRVCLLLATTPELNVQYGMHMPRSCGFACLFELCLPSSWPARSTHDSHGTALLSVVG